MNKERLMQIIREPRISEKATVLADKFKQFSFKVLNCATKPEIKQAVEHLFSVKVKQVTVLNVKGKRKRFKQMSGVRNDWKKAFVTLKAGDKIVLT